MHFHIEKQRYRSCNNIADKTRGGLHNPLSLSLSLDMRKKIKIKGYEASLRL